MRVTDTMGFLLEVLERKLDKPQYDFTKFEYKHSQKKAIIVCKVHGDFLIRPHDFLNGHGCAKCFNEKRASSTDEFLEKAMSRGLAKPQYCFSKFEYKHSQKKAIIVCRAHGAFLITPNHFLKGHGCAKCFNERLSTIKTSSTDEFLEKAMSRGLAKPQYCFSKFKYTRCNQKAIIVCRAHGDFLIRPRDFLDGHGCAKCSKTPHDRSKKTFVYILTDDEDQTSKIGVAATLSLEF